ncbi:MAG: hypothetical protein P8K10_00360 [Crocinitomicaceae bacterium]|nr:hypothetical protein [Crocinitomicaceae bacterium]
MKFIALFVALILQLCFSAKVNAQKPNPELSYTQSEKLIFLDNESGNPNSVTFKAQFKSDGSKNTGTLWEFSGIAGKDWKIIKGSLESEEVELEFKKVGIYSFTLNTTYQYSVAGEEEDEEDEKSIEKENILTVTKNLDELTQIYADKDYSKLVKKTDVYLVKPEYAEDPTPNIFSAKGFYGVYLEETHEKIGLGDKQAALENAIECISAAMELDLNGIFNVSIHKIWLNEFQNEWFENEIIGNLDDEDGYYIPYAGTDKEIKQERNSLSIEGCEVYGTMTKYPIVISFMEAALRYDARDSKTANAIWKKEIPNLELLSDEDFENMTETDLLALKYGAMLSAVKLTEISSSNTQACQILNSLKKPFEYDRTFNAFLKTKYNNCIEE